MSEIEKVLQEKGLDLETYEKIITDCYNKINKNSDDDWQDIVDRYNLGIHYDSLRKNFSGIFGSGFVSDYKDYKHLLESSNDDIVQKYDELKRDFERKKIEYRDSRNAWNRQNYNNARLIETLTILEEELKQIGNINFEQPCPSKYLGDIDEMIVCLSDLHIGQTFNSLFGEYNIDIAKERLQKYLNEIVGIKELHHINKVHVIGLGDLISGNIHKTIAITNKEDVIQQIKEAVSLIASFCYELSKEFEHVYFYNVSGNHSRIDRKDDALHDERLDDLIGWAVSLTLNHIDNFHYMKHRNLDVGIVDISIHHHNYIAVHGDYDPMTKQGISNLCMMLGFIPYSVIRGHNHFPATSTINNVKVIQSGSLSGAGDQHTVEKRLVGKPSQTVLVCNEKGIKCTYDIDL